jgi:hypothetical protein
MSESMNSQKRRCHCLHCKELFLPDYRSQERQRHCSKPECRKARKQASQKAWLQKPANMNYFRDDKNAKAVREWQKAHPGYWKNSARWRGRTLKDACPPQLVVQQEVVENSPTRTLQDLCSMQTPLFVGFISMWVGSTLKDDIAVTTRQLVAKGHDILGMPPGMNRERSLHEKTCSLSPTAPQSSAPV